MTKPLYHSGFGPEGVARPAGFEPTTRWFVGSLQQRASLQIKLLDARQAAKRHLQRRMVAENDHTT